MSRIFFEGLGASVHAHTHTLTHTYSNHLDVTNHSWRTWCECTHTHTHTHTLKSPRCHEQFREPLIVAPLTHARHSRTRRVTNITNSVSRHVVSYIVCHAQVIHIARTRRVICKSQTQSVIEIWMSQRVTARSLEDETRNARRNANRNSEWWRDFHQLQIQIKPKSGFECVPRDT